MTTGHPNDGTRTEGVRREGNAGKSTRDRVYETAIQLYEPTTAEDVARRSNCSTGAARNHLEWFVDRGIVDVFDGRPKRYVRNQAYFDWKRADELRRDHTDAEFQKMLEELDAQEREFRDRYGVEHPTEIDATAFADFGELHAVWEDIGDWKTIRRRVRLLERARKEREQLADATG